MLPNALASVNASLCSTALWLIKGLKLPKEQIVVIHDNEPRSKSICSEYEKTISAGFKTVIWPTNCHYKDINDIVMHNEDPIKVITNNTYSGLLAQLQFTKYCKVTY
jgi:sulfur carrier protein ThiS